MTPQKVTVILLTYNHVSTISQSLKSILSQITTFKFNVMILDDASDDGTSDVCQSFQDKYPELFFHNRHKTNLGPASNLRFGFDRIISPYIAFLEGDDYWTDDFKLQIMTDKMEQHPDCVIGGHETRLVNKQKSYEKLFNGDKIIDDEVQLFSGPPAPFRIHPSSRIYKNLDCLRTLPENLLFDTHILRHYLLIGKGLYVNREMSVFNESGSGFWSGRKRIDRKIMTLNLYYEASRYYKYEQDEYFFNDRRSLRVLKKLLGKKKGWELYHFFSLRFLLLRKRWMARV